MKSTFTFILRLCHPILLPFFFLATLLLIVPNYFGYSCYHKGFLFLFQTFNILILLPIIGIFLITRLKLIGSLEMQSSKERIIPLIIILTLGIWYYLNIKGQFHIYEIYKEYILATVISTSLALFTTIFYNISFHSIGWTVVLGSIIKTYKTTKNQYHFDGHCLQWDFDQMTIILVIFCLFTFLVTFGQFYLKQHSKMEIANGALIGSISFILSNIILN